MSFQSFNFNFTNVAPSIGEVLEYIRSADLENDHPAVLFTQQIVQNLSIDNGISGGYMICNVDSLQTKEGLLRIGTRELNLGGQVCNYIKEAKQIALFVCTASESFTTLSNELNEKGDVMEAYIVDAIGSLTVENTMDRIQEQLRISMNKSGWEISNRYSPGYCNWPLSDQKNLFEIIGNNSTEITINDSCLMTPRKSISGIIGIGKKLKRHEYGCKICTNDHCIYRKLTVEN